MATHRPHPALAATACAGLLLILFSPRFVLWKGLQYPESWFNPEVNRAISALLQLQDPWAPVANPSNKVLQWRLLFPLLFRYAGLPAVLYLLMPSLGCLLTLGLILRLAYSMTDDLWESVAAALTLGSASWFFVSTGWLAYFDSWLALGLLAAVFTEGFLLACLLTPWIDERFILAFPLCLLLRTKRLGKLRRRETAWALAALSVYLLPRAAAWALGSDADSGRYLSAARADPYEARVVVEGIWQGLRGGWLFVLRLLVRSRDPWLLAAAAATLPVNLFIAGDISRSMTVFLPAALAGIEGPPRRRKPFLAAAAAAAVLLPAKHVTRAFSIPISSLAAEIKSFRHPPPYLDPSGYVARGSSRMRRGNLAGAAEDFATALRVDPCHPEALRALDELQRRRGGAALKAPLECAPAPK